MVELVWETVPCGRSSGAKDAVSELGSCTWLHVGSCVGGSQSRTTAGLCNCLNAVCQSKLMAVDDFGSGTNSISDMPFFNT